MNIPDWDKRIPPCHFSSDKFVDYLPQIENAINNNLPYSWIRIGDGEESVLGQDYLYPINNVKAHVGWWNNDKYCGTTLPNIELRDRMINAYKGSEAIGVFINSKPTIDIFSKAGIEPKQIFYAYDNVHLPMNIRFVRMLCKYKILVVCGGLRENRNGQYYAEELNKRLDINVEFVNLPRNYNDLNECMNQIRIKDFDLALVSAGVNAKVICYEMSREMNKAFMDFGHGFDNAFYEDDKGNYKDYFLLDKSML